MTGGAVAIARGYAADGRRGAEAAETTALDVGSNPTIPHFRVYHVPARGCCRLRLWHGVRASRSHPGRFSDRARKRAKGIPGEILSEQAHLHEPEGIRPCDGQLFKEGR